MAGAGRGAEAVSDLATRMSVRYARRPADRLYRSTAVRDEVRAEWLRAVRATLARAGRPIPVLSLLEVGADHGHNMPYWRGLGFEAITLNDIRPEVAHIGARWGVPYLTGDAATKLGPKFADIIYAGTVFSSILGWPDRVRLADGLWRAARVGVLLYDFTVPNPLNPDVAPLTEHDVEALFPVPAVATRLTLLPPLARVIPGWLYRRLNRPALQTHRLWWLAKEPRDAR